MADRIVETVTEYEQKPPCRTAEEMAEICCEDTPALPCCEKVEPWQGYTTEEALEHLGIELDDQGRDSDGNYVVIDWLPRKSPCGIQVTEYDVTPKNCCDDPELTPLEYDIDSAVEVLAPGSDGIVYFSGGRLPVFIKIRGVGFTLDGYSQRDGWIYGNSFRIFAHEFACGTCLVTLNDGCSIAIGEIRSTAGHWDGICPGYTVYCTDAYGSSYGTTMSFNFNSACEFVTAPEGANNYTHRCTAASYRYIGGGGWSATGGASLEPVTAATLAFLMGMDVGTSLGPDPGPYRDICIVNASPCRWIC